MKKSAREVFENFLTDNFSVSYETKNRYFLYFDLLTKWQKKINLISDTTPDEIWSRHLLDSVQLGKFIPNRSSTIIDIGSGAGFPGLALAILGYENVTLVESDTKKCVFLKEAARATYTDVAVANMRVENVQKKSFDIITSRACADLTLLLEYSFPLVSHGTTCLFLKGKKCAIEIDEAKNKWDFDHQTSPSITSNDGVILTITNLRHRD